MWTSRTHDCKDGCSCAIEENEAGDEELVRNPECPVVGHSDIVARVEFSDDGAQVISGSSDGTVRLWDLASGRQVRQLAGNEFALVKGLSGELRRDRHILTALDDKLLIYQVAKEQQHSGNGAAAAPVACFKAPQRIMSLHCHGAAICVGCVGGAVCILSAPFLAV